MFNFFGLCTIWTVYPTHVHSVMIRSYMFYTFSSISCTVWLLILQIVEILHGYLLAGLLECYRSINMTLVLISLLVNVVLFLKPWPLNYRCSDRATQRTVERRNPLLASIRSILYEPYSNVFIDWLGGFYTSHKFRYILCTSGNIITYMYILVSSYL